jgi:hypothetical protein
MKNTIPSFVREDAFVQEYANQLKALINEVPEYECGERRLYVAYNMIKAVAEDTSRWDVYANNPAAKRAGKKAGCATSKHYRECVRELWANGWLQDESKKLRMPA